MILALPAVSKLVFQFLVNLGRRDPREKLLVCMSPELATMTASGLVFVMSS